MENNWIGGKSRGWLSIKDTNIQVFFPRTSNIKSKSFFYKKFNDDKEKTLEEAKKYQKQISDENNLTYNMYRYCKDENGEYLEVQLQRNKPELIMKCDVEDLPIVEERVWIGKKEPHKKPIYVQGRKNKQMKYIHNFICPKYNEVDHINRDGLDNRKINLREGKIIIDKEKNDKTNKNIINVNAFNKGIRIDNKYNIINFRKHYSGKKWNYRWYTSISYYNEKNNNGNSKRKSKSFSEFKYGGRNKAKKEAFNYLKEEYKKLNNSFKNEEIIFNEEKEDIFINDDKKWIATYKENNKNFEVNIINEKNQREQYYILSKYIDNKFYKKNWELNENNLEIKEI